jgi:hypothetical protein
VFRVVASPTIENGFHLHGIVGFFHGVNALAIADIAASLAGAEWRAVRVASAR